MVINKQLLFIFMEEAQSPNLWFHISRAAFSKSLFLMKFFKIHKWETEEEIKTCKVHVKTGVLKVTKTKLFNKNSTTEKF